jgi:uncharacterized protein (TIGR03084 family)
MEDQIVDALEAEQCALAEMVTDLEAEALRGASRCEGWTVVDVLVHLAQTNELAAASVEGNFDEAVGAGPEIVGVSNVEEWAGAAVEADRPGDPTEAVPRYLASAGRQLSAFRAVEPSERVVWVVGDMAARTLASTRLSETWIHAGDIAAGLGITPEPTGRLWHVARLAHRTIPYAFIAAGREPLGEVAFVLDAPGGSEWVFGDPDAPTVIRGKAEELCLVAGQRASAADTELEGEGPDAARALELVRTFA